MLLCGQALSCRRRTLSTGKLGPSHRIFALSLIRVSMYASKFIVSLFGKKSTTKNTQQNFMNQWYMLSFEGGTLLLREMVTMLKSRDVIHRGPTSFWCMIHVPVSVIIPVLKKKALLFDCTHILLVIFLNNSELIFCT